jgi:hypothetical protein
LIYSKNGIQVATVGPDNHVRLKRVTIARDLGNMIELASGIDRHERVIDSPPDGIANGDAVRIVEPQKAAP